MKYTPYIQLALDQLERLGIQYEIIQGVMVSIDQIRECEDRISFSLPKQYKEYLLEIGDGFSLRYETPVSYLESKVLAAIDSDSSKQDEALKEAKNGHFNVWGLESIEATLGEWECNQEELSEENIEEYLEWNGEDYLDECRRRRCWLPISGIGDGGYSINIDCNTDCGSIRYNDIRRPGDPESTYLADDLESLMANWSRYTFSDPIYSNGLQGYLSSLCYSIRGVFPWSDSNFLPQFKIANI